MKPPPASGRPDDLLAADLTVFQAVADRLGGDRVGGLKTGRKQRFGREIVEFGGGRLGAGTAAQAALAAGRELTPRRRREYSDSFGLVADEGALDNTP